MRRRLFLPGRTESTMARNVSSVIVLVEDPKGENVMFPKTDHENLEPFTLFNRSFEHLPGVSHLDDEIHGNPWRHVVVR